jgi:hypothetical protein
MDFWLARYPFMAVHYAGLEATEEEWHDSLVMRDFMTTEEEEGRRGGGAAVSEVAVQVPQ